MRYIVTPARCAASITSSVATVDPGTTVYVDGPHGVALSPDKKFLFVSTAHGAPFGFLWKYALEGDSVAGRVMLGNFPATAQVTPDGAFA